MEAFQAERLQRYTEDAKRWLTQIKMILTYPETPAQAASLAMARAALELVEGIRIQTAIAQENKGE